MKTTTNNAREMFERDLEKIAELASYYDSNFYEEETEILERHYFPTTREKIARRKVSISFYIGAAFSFVGMISAMHYRDVFNVALWSALATALTLFGTASETAGK